MNFYFWRIFSYSSNLGSQIPQVLSISIPHANNNDSSKKKNENSKRIGKGEKKGTENENERSGKRIRKIQRPLSLGFMSIESIACPSIEIYDKGFPGIFSMENS